MFLPLFSRYKNKPLTNTLKSWIYEKFLVPRCPTFFHVCHQNEDAYKTSNLNISKIDQAVEISSSKSILNFFLKNSLAEKNLVSVKHQDKIKHFFWLSLMKPLLYILVEILCRGHKKAPRELQMLFGQHDPIRIWIVLRYKLSRYKEYHHSIKNQ